jgi:hypothetical protein
MTELLHLNLLIVIVVKSFVVSVVSNIREEGRKTVQTTLFSYQGSLSPYPPGSLLHLLHPLSIGPNP